LSLHNYEKRFYADLSEKTLFQKDILEKVHRLISILEYINSNPEIEGMLALKGGTPINMIIFNMPRLSVDIDLDFSLNATREEMLRKRNNINILLKKYFESEGYTIEPKSKTHFSLDSWVIGYTNTSGNHDNLKVEIN
jgi:predicted nucleotidyltransferase component of viral defense system